MKNIFVFSKYLSSKNLVIMKKTKLIEKIENRCAHFQSHPLMYSYTPRLSSLNLPSPMWYKFHRQKDAFDFSETKTDAKVFSVEMTVNKGSGARSFIVASLEEFWTYYAQMPLSQRHFYEIIQDGFLCHLYFDLEFNKALNESSDGEKMTRLWIELINLYIKKQFDITTCCNHVLQLDSSTSIKFSQHLIWHIPNAAFKNNIEVGSFVKMICHDIKHYNYLREEKFPAAAEHWLHESRISSQLHHLLIKTSSDEKSLFVDEGVYTRNRNFRLFMSTKKGKTAEMQRSANCCFDIQAVDLQSTCCKYHYSTSKPALTSKHSHSQRKLTFFLSLVSNVNKHEDLKMLEMPSTNDFSSSPHSKKHLYSHNCRKHRETEMKHTDLPSSLLDKLHNFVTQYIRQFSEGACIYKVSRQGNGIFYDIRGTRYCPTIGREHKSNNIFVVVQLDSQLCYHRCYDHECRASSTKPNPFPIPSSIVNSSDLVLFFSDLSQEVSDSDLLACVEKIEENSSD